MVVKKFAKIIVYHSFFFDGKSSQKTLRHQITRKANLV